ncbi:MAG TPA: hypothetical protein VIZ61_12345 [Solirubrobacterales bacterium]
MRRWRLIAPAFVVVAGLTLTACTSSQDKARAIRERADATAPKPLVIAKPSKDVKVGDTTLLHDQNGDAIVVPLTNESSKMLVSVPILVDIRDAKGTTVYKNDTAGIDYALNHIALIKPHETFSWVNDQVTGQGKTVKVKVGEPETKPPAGALPQYTVSDPRFGSDFSGVKVSGTVKTDSKIDQSHLILFAVARQGERIVAAGRGQIKKLKGEAKPSPYVIYFIGDPTGSEVTIQAPPTTFEGIGELGGTPEQVGTQ